MKKIILIAILIIATFTINQNIKAQITLEHTYDSAANNLYIVTLEVEGMKYVYRDNDNSEVRLYNLDHSIFKTMLYPTTKWYSLNLPSVLYISEHLFNNDDSIEFMFVYTAMNANPYYQATVILNEAGTILFEADSMAPNVQGNFPEAQLPIYNTPNGTKMILSQTGTMANPNPNANVYGLTGTLTNSIKPFNNTWSNQMIENIYPNPSTGNTTIEFNLPQGENTGQLVIYNNKGVEMKKYNVDNTFHTLLLNNNEFHAGIYYYQLITSSGVSGARKMVVIKE